MKTFINLSQSNFLHNLNVFKQITGKKLMLTVKANGYGHGLIETVTMTKDLPYIEYYGVDSFKEADAVRKIDNHKKILVLGWSDEDELEAIITNQFETVAPSLEFIKLADSLAKKNKTKIRLHLKVETGTSRLGMLPEQILEIFNSSDYPNIEITGLYSHFANIEDTTDHSYAVRQLNIYNDLLSKLGPKSNQILKHFSCSAAALLFPKTYFDIVRLGISAYGYWPSKPTYISYMETHHEKIELKPVLSWYSRVAQVKTLNTGDHIGYGITYRTFNKSKIAVVPVGYYDGYDRRFSNTANIIVKGVKAPVRGRICMDMFMAEVTHVKNIKAGNLITLLGREGDESIDADHLANISGSISYEILSRLNPFIPRFIVD